MTEYLSFDFEVKHSDADKGVIEGYGSVFGNLHLFAALALTLLSSPARDARADTAASSAYDRVMKTKTLRCGYHYALQPVAKSYGP